MASFWLIENFVHEKNIHFVYHTSIDPGSMESNSNLNSDEIFASFWKFIFLNLAIASVLMLIRCPRCILSWDGLLSIRFDFIFSFLMSSFLSFGGYYVDNYFEKRISWIEEPVKRFLVTVITYMLYSFVISFILITCMVLIMVEDVTLSNISWARMVENTIMPTIIAFVIISIFISRGWLMEWRNTAIEAEQLKSEKFASQYQSLKDQLNPHFLFNSLNVLSNLVYESADRSAEFIQQLSKIYRYVLEIQQEELVSLEKELSFATHYLSLQKIRFENNLEYFMDIGQVKGKYLPPLSLQLLLENAIKHNIASQEKPLRIVIEQSGDKLIVRNILQPKLTRDSNDDGIGLSNIKKRYDLLSDQVPKITETENEFIVELPLLHLAES